MNDLDLIILEDSLKVLRKNSDTPEQLQKLYELGDLFQSKRQYQKALIYARQALDLSNEKSNLDHQVMALVNTWMCLLGDVAVEKSCEILSECPIH